MEEKRIYEELMERSLEGKKLEHLAHAKVQAASEALLKTDYEDLHAELSAVAKHSMCTIAKYAYEYYSKDLSKMGEIIAAYNVVPDDTVLKIAGKYKALVKEIDKLVDEFSNAD